MDKGESAQNTDRLICMGPHTTRQCSRFTFHTYIENEIAMFYCRKKAICVCSCHINKIFILTQLPQDQFLHEKELSSCLKKAETKYLRKLNVRLRYFFIL